MRATSWLKTGCLGLLVVGLSALGTGCSDSANATAKVKGKVKFFDKYLTAGTVTFTSKDGRVGSGIIDIDGNYEVGNAPVGECVITVKVPQVIRGPAGKKFEPKPPPGLPPMPAPETNDPGPTMASSNIDTSK